MITAIPDELVMAFADGELEAPLASSVHAAILSDDGVRRKYDIFLSTRPLGGSAFESILSEPVPERLRRAIAASKRRV